MLRNTIACVLVILSCGGAYTSAEPNATRTHGVEQTVHIAQPAKGETRYFYFPFTVIPNTHRIKIRYDYDKANGQNVLDIGLFDSSATTKPENLKGFRGWSGGRRSELSMSRDDATPGYTSGEMPAGTWKVILGLYRVAPGGVDVTFKIDLETNENKETTVAASTVLSPIVSPVQSTPVTRLAKRDPLTQKDLRRWLVGDLHMHTVHSDGDWSITELANAATKAGLDFISVTDHNTRSHHVEIDKVNSQSTKPMIIRGEEITTYGGHANAWGLPRNGVVDFRVTPEDRAGISKIIKSTHDLGALISINHPLAVCGGCNWSYDRDADGFDAIEVWNGPWDPTDGLAVEMWDRLLQKGRHITAIASSDSHRPATPLGEAATHVAISGALSEGTLLKAIKGGHVYLTATAQRPKLTFETQSSNGGQKIGIGDTVRVNRPRRLRFKVAVSGINSAASMTVISQGQIVRTFQIKSVDELSYFDVAPNQNTYFRVELRDEDGKMLALTNPIYVETKN